MSDTLLDALLQIETALQRVVPQMIWVDWMADEGEPAMDALRLVRTVNDRERQREAALAAIYALRRARDESTNHLTANSRFIDQEVLVALGELERAFLAPEGTPIG